MPRLDSLTALQSPPVASVPAPGLRVIDEAARQPVPPRPAASRWEALSPMPLAGLPPQPPQPQPQPQVEEEDPQLPDDDDFERDFLPSRQAREDGKLKELPRFVPLQSDVFAVSGGDPWSVRSVGGLLKLYLPEISLSTAAIVGSGALAGRLLSRFGGASLGPEILIAYLAIQSLVLALAYASAKGASSLRIKTRMRLHLLVAFVVLAFHMLAYGLLVAGR